MIESAQYAGSGIPQALTRPGATPLISGTMAMDSLKEQVAAAVAARVAYEQQRAIRDDLIRDARRARIPVAQLQRVTGLGRDRIVKITAEPSRQETDR